MKSLVILICTWIMAVTGVTEGTGTQVHVPGSVVKNSLNNMLRLERRVTKLSLDLKATKTKLETVERSLNSKRAITGKGRSVSFQVRQKSHLLSVSNDEVLKFEDVKLNSGNAYNPNSGIFITPVTGTYFFWADVMSYDKRPVVITLQKDGHELARGHTGYEVKHGVATIVYMTKLKKGEHVWFRNEERGGVKSKIYGNKFSYYGGALVFM